VVLAKISRYTNDGTGTLAESHLVAGSGRELFGREL